MSYQIDPDPTSRPEPSADAEAQLGALYGEFCDACGKLTELEEADTKPFTSSSTQAIERERNATVDAIRKIIEAAAPLSAWNVEALHSKAVLARHAAELIFESGTSEVMVPEAALVLSFIMDVEQRAYIEITGADYMATDAEGETIAAINAFRTAKLKSE